MIASAEPTAAGMASSSSSSRRRRGRSFVTASVSSASSSSSSSSSHPTTRSNTRERYGADVNATVTHIHSRRGGLLAANAAAGPAPDFLVAKLDANEKMHKELMDKLADPAVQGGLEGVSKGFQSHGGAARCCSHVSEVQGVFTRERGGEGDGERSRRRRRDGRHGKGRGG